MELIETLRSGSVRAMVESLVRWLTEAEAVMDQGESGKRWV